MNLGGHVISFVVVVIIPLGPSVSKLRVVGNEWRCIAIIRCRRIRDEIRFRCRFERIVFAKAPNPKKFIGAIIEFNDGDDDLSGLIWRDDVGVGINHVFFGAPLWRREKP